MTIQGLYPEAVAPGLGFRKPNPLWNGPGCHQRGRTDMLNAMRPNPIVILSIVVTLAANIALDTFTDVPMLIRWTLSVGLGLLATLALSKWSQRRKSRRNNDALDRP
ncbi:MAG: hypothetical protein WCC45_15690 [Paeniglutamicibacter sp.]|uniref:hypothetical protein n=1 Tax=Arthrobacter sp. UCD-GKA TaxID=1913576 RepID=UPI00111449DD|nr:hypothetical protein [Arthrobacter sp. UCD-GKA]